MKPLFLIAFLFVSSAFNKTDEINSLQTSTMNIDVGFQIAFKNPKGNDLLDPLTENHYRHSEIKLYSDKYLKNEIPDKLVNTTSDGSRYFIQLFGAGNTPLSDGITRGAQYLQLREGVVDTIVTEITQSGSSQRLSKVDYNGITVYRSGDIRYLEVIR